jgi:hypothetical protein
VLDDLSDHCVAVAEVPNRFFLRVERGRHCVGLFEQPLNRHQDCCDVEPHVAPVDEGAAKSAGGRSVDEGRDGGEVKHG